MKNNIFGYVFFIFIIIIMGFAIYRVKTAGNDENNESGTTASAVSTKEKGTELTLGISDLDTINPIITKNKNVQNVTKLIYEPLINITEDGKLEACLASEWAKTDSTTYIVQIKTGIQWSDGESFTSDDVKFTIDKLKESDDSVYSDCVRYVKEVDIIDNTTLRIILSREVPFFEYYLIFPILSSKYYSGEDFWDTKKNEAPVTTGRFMISEVTGKKILLTKNENWWNREQETPVIETINLNTYSSVAELYNAFKLGRIDLIATENENYEEYIGTIGYNTTEIEGREFVFLAFNTQNNYLSDANVRKGIRAAINKSEIVSTIYGKMYNTANFPLLTSSYLVNEGDENYYKIDEVKNYLNMAGWRERSMTWQKTIDGNTVRLELNLVVQSKNSKRMQVAEYIRNALANQGIIVNIIQASNKEFQNYLENKNFDMILCEMTMAITPNLATFFGSGNIANYSNDELNEIMNSVNNITDENELQSRYQKIYDIYNNEVPYIGIARSKIAVITNSYLAGEIRSKWYNLFFGFNEWYTS